MSVCFWVISLQESCHTCWVSCLDCCAECITSQARRLGGGRCAELDRATLQADPGGSYPAQRPRCPHQRQLTSHRRGVGCSVAAVVRKECLSGMRPSALCCIVKIRTCPALGILMTAELRRGARARRPKLELHAAAIDPTATLGTVAGVSSTRPLLRQPKPSTILYTTLQDRGPASAIRHLKLLSPRRRGKGPFNRVDRCQLDSLFPFIGLLV